jgi:hypothetical protein
VDQVHPVGVGGQTVQLPSSPMRKAQADRKRAKAKRWAGNDEAVGPQGATPCTQKKSPARYRAQFVTISAVQYRATIGPPNSYLPPTGSCKTDFTKTTAHSCSKGSTIRYSRSQELQFMDGVREMQPLLAKAQSGNVTLQTRHANGSDQKPNSAKPTQLNAKRQHAAAAAEASFAIVLAVGMT